MAPNTLFNESKVESLALIAAIAHPCSGGAGTKDGQQCTYDTGGARQTCCAAHLALTEDQRFSERHFMDAPYRAAFTAEEFAEAVPEERLLPYRGGVNRAQCHCGRC